ncbi:MAG: hypothetical protein AAFQ54_07975 [Pseudomonadota bacterium]
MNTVSLFLLGLVIAAASTALGWAAARVLTPPRRDATLAAPLDARLRAIEEHVEWIATDRMIGVCSEIAGTEKGARLKLGPTGLSHPAPAARELN